MSSHIEWACADSVAYVPPWHSVPDGTPSGTPHPDFDDTKNTQDAHVLLFMTGSDGCAIQFDTLEHMHVWLDQMKEELPALPPGKGAGVDEIEAFLNG